MHLLDHIISDMDKALNEDLRPQHIAEDLYEWFKSGISVINPFSHLLLTVFTIVLVIIIACVVLPCLMRVVVTNLTSAGKVIAQQRSWMQNKKGEL